MRRNLQVDINRTASTSRRNALGVRGPKHSTALLLREQNRERFEDSFIWTFVRHPFDRILSEWKHRHTYHGGEDLNAWLKDLFTPGGRTPEKPLQSYRERLFWPQTCWIMDGEGRLLTDWIGHYETLQEDWQTLCRDHLNIVPPELPHRNEADDRRGWREVFSPVSVRLMSIWFRDDFERLGYSEPYPYEVE